MHFLIKQKFVDTYSEYPDMLVMSFPDRAELLKYALDMGIKLGSDKTVIIINGETGVERGTADIRSELMEMEVADVKEG